MRRAAGVLGSMRATGCEQRIARLVFGREQDEGHDAATVSLPPGLIIGDLRFIAIEEAARLEQARRLIADTATTSFDGRPCITMLGPQTQTPSELLGGIA